jgi:membrane associated rhomboid family serine protease
LYFISGIIAALCWCLVNWNSEAVAFVSQGFNIYKVSIAELDEALADGYKLERISGGCVGASGSIFGLLVATALAFPDVRVQLLFPPVAMKMRTFAIVYIVIEILSLFNTNTNVAHIAHLGGALGGFIYMRRLCPKGNFLTRLFTRRRKPTMRVLTNDDFCNDEAEFMSSPEVGRILKKFSKVGHDGLTEEEREVLKRVVQIMSKYQR